MITSPSVGSLEDEEYVLKRYIRCLGYGCSGCCKITFHSMYGISCCPENKLLNSGSYNIKNLINFIENPNYSGSIHHYKWRALWDMKNKQFVEDVQKLNEILLS